MVKAITNLFKSQRVIDAEKRLDDYLKKNPMRKGIFKVTRQGNTICATCETIAGCGQCGDTLTLSRLNGGP